MKKLLLNILENAKQAIDNVKSNQELNELRAYYMGKKSPLGDIMKKMGSLSIDEKKEFGALANKVKAEIEEKITNARNKIEEREIERKLASEKNRCYFTW